MMQSRRSIPSWWIAVVLVCAVAPAPARSLHDRLLSLGDPAGVRVPTGGPGASVRVPATLEFDYFAPVVSRTAVRAVDRPVIAAAPGFVFVFDPQADAFRRERVLAPVFVDRAGTVGRGRVEVGAMLDGTDLDRVDGGGFGDAVGLTRTVVGGTRYVLLQRLHVDDFHLRTVSAVAYVTVGLAERLDLTLVAPLVWSQLDATVRRQFASFDAGAQPLGRTGFLRRRARGDATGLGDLLLRAKLLVWSEGTAHLATTLAIRAPTGDPANFQGLGDTLIIPGVTGSLRWGPAELNAGLGLDLNADDTSRSRVRYVAGSTVAVRDWAALVLEVVGSSGLDDDRFEVPGVLRTVRGVDLVAVDPLASRTTLAVPRSDVVDLAVAGKFRLGESGAAFLGVLVPLTSDGLRGAATPIVGIDVAF